MSARVIQTFVRTCADCLNCSYYSGGMYECALIGERISPQSKKESTGDRCPLPFAGPISLTAAGYRILAPGSLDEETLERAAQWHDGQAEGYRTNEPLPGEDSYEVQIRFHECSAAQIRALKAGRRALQEERG